MLRPAELDRADVDVIRREVFTSSTFYVTNITQVSSAWLICAQAHEVARLVATELRQMPHCA